MYSKSNKHINWAEMYKCYKAWVSETSTEDNFQNRSFMAAQSLNNITSTYSDKIMKYENCETIK